MVNTLLLKGKIVSAGFTQRALAAKMGLSKNTLNAKVNSRSDICSNEIMELCGILGITKDEEKAEIFLSVPSHNRDRT